MTTRAFPGRVTGDLDPQQFVGDDDIRAIEGTFLAETLAPAAPGLDMTEAYDHTMEPPEPAPGQFPTPSPMA